MVVDSSAVLAILLGESDAVRYADAMERADVLRMSAANFLEAAIVIDSRGDAIASRRLDGLVQEAGVLIESLTQDQAQLARQAYRDFGKGRHKAGLNFGDCIAYALAKAVAEPLLYKGRDFGHTDVEVATKG